MANYLKGEFMRKHIYFGVTLIICILLFCVKLTGNAVHAALGSVLLLTAAIHICNNRKKLRSFSKKTQVINFILLLFAACMVITGIGFHLFQNMLVLKILHKLFGTFFFCMVLLHSKQLCMKNCKNRA